MTDQSGERNPFRPTASSSPVVLAGRSAELSLLLDALGDVPEIPFNARITGIRGVGKTALLTEFGRRAEDQSWATISLELGDRYNYEGELASRLASLATAKRETLSFVVATRSRVASTAVAVARAIHFDIGDWTIGLDLAGSGADLARSLAELGETAISAGKLGCIFLLDEAQLIYDQRDKDDFPLSMLVATFAELQRRGAPIVLVLAGLPTLDRNLGRARSQSERLFRGVPVESLDDEAAEEAFRGPLLGTSTQPNRDVVKAVVEFAEGYPHFIQIFGSVLWTEARARKARRINAAVLRAVERDVRERIDVDIYDFRMEQLEPHQRDVLLAASRCGYPPLTVARLVDEGVAPGPAQSCVDAMIELGYLDDPAARAEYVFTVPRFHDYLIRRGQRWAPTSGPTRSAP